MMAVSGFQVKPGLNKAVCGDDRFTQWLATGWFTCYEADPVTLLSDLPAHIPVNLLLPDLFLPEH